MKKVILGLVFIIVCFMIVQTIRFNYGGRQVSDFIFFDLNKKKIELSEIFNQKNEKLILYILPECESCTFKIQSILNSERYSNTQLIIISAGLKNFDFTKFYQDNFAKTDVTFLIDVNNTFYRDFGLGFTEEFPTVVKYELDANTFKKIN